MKLKTEENLKMKTRFNLNNTFYMIIKKKILELKINIKITIIFNFQKNRRLWKFINFDLFKIMQHCILNLFSNAVIYNIKERKKTYFVLTKSCVYHFSLIFGWIFMC